MPESKFLRLLKKSSPLILSCIGSVGVIFTAISSSKATLKASNMLREEAVKERKKKGPGHEHDTIEFKFTTTELIKFSWKYYVPSVIILLGTISCIFGANILNKKQQAALSGAYILIANKYKDYINKVKEIYGEEAHKHILEEIEIKKPKDVRVYTPNLTGYSSLDFDDGCEIPILFYDSFSERYFESTISRVLLAEYHLNRSFSLGWIPSVNDFYDFLGLDHTDVGEQIGWVNANGEYYWIDFSHTKKYLDDGKTPYYVIDAEFPSYPVTDYINER